MPGSVRTRFAPSPTGSMHVGNLHTALFNWIFARKNEGVVVLRIEDTDELRSTPEALGIIYDSLKWLDLDWDEGPDIDGPHGPYIQSERLELYEQKVNELLDAGKAYRCYCTPEEVEERRQIMRARGEAPKYDGKCRNLTIEEQKALEAEGREYCVRFKMKETGSTVINDLIQGEVVYENNLAGDPVIFKQSGFPTYHLAVVVDDDAMDITHVIRGAGHLPNTQIHMQLQEALGIPHPAYAHLPIILGEDRTKLAKRHGAVSVTEYRDMGYLPEAMFNFLALLGWSPGSEEEVLSREEIIRRFSLKDCSRAPSVFDLQKAEWLNGEHMKQMDSRELAERIHPWLVDADLFEQEPSEERWEWLTEVVDLMKERAKLLTTFVNWARYFFTDDYEFENRAREEWLNRDTTPDVLDTLADRFEQIDDWNVDTVEEAIRGLADNLDVGAGKVIHPCRAAITGTTIGPSLFHLVAVLEQHDVINRLRKAAEMSRAGQMEPTDSE
ncbi:MAG: glutamate--tRNA ligase [Armatimonadota bacterium]